MEIELPDASGVPEALKSSVKEADGKYVLDLSQLAPAADLEKFKGKALTAEQEAIDRRKALNAWKELGESPDAIREALKGSKKSEDQERIVEELRKEYEGKISERDAKLSSLASAQIETQLMASLADAGVMSERLSRAMRLVRDQVKMGEDGSVQIFTEDGKPMTGSAPNGGATISDLAKMMAESMPEWVDSKFIGGSGKPPNSTGGTPPKKTLTRSAFESLSQAERADFIKTGGKVTHD